MRVVHVVPAVTIGGLWRHLQAAAKLVGRGFDLMIVSLFDADDPSALASISRSIVRLRLPLERYRDEKMIRATLSKTLRELAPDLLHSHHYYSDLYVFPCATELGVSAIRSVHGITQVPSDNLFRRDQIKYDWSLEEIRRELELEAGCQLTLSVSSHLRNRLIEYGWPKEKVEVLYPGVNPRALAKGSMYAERNRRPTAAEEAFMVGFVGRLEPVKNPLGAIEVIRQCVQDGLPVKLTMIGGGRLLQEIVNTIKRHGLQGRIQVLAPIAAVEAKMIEFDALVLTSYSEGLPLAMLEAMALGIPVLATDIGGIPEVIEPRRNGFLFKPDDVWGMKIVLTELAADEAFRRQIGIRAMETIRSRFDLKAHVESLASIYQRLHP